MRSSAVLPPLQALRAFEAVGRLLSFRRAGEELLITQSAVSHHIRGLEEALGVRLFERRARTIALTPAGDRYLNVITQAFALIAEGTGELTQARARQRLRVSLLPSFAANWLVPRLAYFQARHPTIDIELDPTLRVIDLSAGEADLAIRYGGGRWLGARGELLMSEQLTPVLSPALAQRQPLEVPSQLLGHTLLLTKNPADWDIWSETMALDLSRAKSIQLTDYNIVLQAALDGQGVALGRRLLVEDRIRTGALVAPLATVVDSQRAGHWLVMPERRRLTPAARTFADWIKTEVGDPAAATLTGLQSAHPGAHCPAFGEVQPV
jgi:LysR family glycine cleavage system transcriptional activator